MHILIQIDKDINFVKHSCYSFHLFLKGFMNMQWGKRRKNGVGTERIISSYECDIQ